MIWMILLCGLGMVGGGAYLMLHESMVLGALAAVAGLALVVFGGWVSSRETRAEAAEESERTPS